MARGVSSTVATVLVQVQPGLSQHQDHLRETTMAKKKAAAPKGQLGDWLEEIPGRGSEARGRLRRGPYVEVEGVCEAEHGEGFVNRVHEGTRVFEGADSERGEVPGTRCDRQGVL